MNERLAWLLIALAAFACGAWWQYAGCELKQKQAQEEILDDDSKAVENLKPGDQRREIEHAKTIQIIRTSPDACLRERIPAGIDQRLPERPPD